MMSPSAQVPAMRRQGRQMRRGQANAANADAVAQVCERAMCVQGVMYKLTPVQ